MKKGQIETWHVSWLVRPAFSFLYFFPYSLSSSLSPIPRKRTKVDAFPPPPHQKPNAHVVSAVVVPVSGCAADAGVVSVSLVVVGEEELQSLVPSSQPPSNHQGLRVSC